MTHWGIWRIKDSRLVLSRSSQGWRAPQEVSRITAPTSALQSAHRVEDKAADGLGRTRYLVQVAPEGQGQVCTRRVAAQENVAVAQSAEVVPGRERLEQLAGVL